jgi:hypothetical protein
MREYQLAILVKTAYDDKPKRGEPCNNCGWCCLTEVCPVGAELTGNTKPPCTLIESKDGKHYCKLGQLDGFKEVLGLGTECCAATQQEIIEELQSENS